MIAFSFSIDSVMFAECCDSLQANIESVPLLVVMSVCQSNEWNPTPVMFSLTVSVYILSIDMVTASLCLLW